VVRLLIAANIRLYREGLREILSRAPELDVIGTAATAQETLGMVDTMRPDVVLLDLAMASGLSVVRELYVAAPTVKVVVLGVAEDETQVVACAEAGVTGYVSRDASLTDLIATLESVGRGELLCSPRQAATLLRRVAALASGDGTETTGARLTARELEISRLLERGYSNKDIARGLGIEVATVKNHVHSILGKLHVHRRGQAAAHMRGGRADHPSH